MAVLLLIISLVLFVGLVVVHEWGHFIVARRNGIVAEEFSIFFPPRIFSRKMKDGWRFSIGLLPLGGFVKLKGEHDSDTDEGSFGAASTWAKSKVMIAGVVMNFIVAFLLLTIVALMGMPKLVDNQFTVNSDTTVSRNDIYIGYVEPGSPAAKAGMVSTDRLTGYQAPGQATVELKSASNLPDITTKYAGQPVTFYYVTQGGKHVAKTITLRTDAAVKASANTDNPKGHLGIQPSELTLQRSTWSAPVVAGGLMGQFTALTFQGLGKALAGLGGIVAGVVTGNHNAREAAQTEASSQVAGPVGIFFVLKSGSTLGYQYILFVIALISLTLAIMNILPLPALDGGRLWLMLASRAIGKPISARAEELINAVGFVVLLALIVVISTVDVKRFF
jgi:regulator of sigma E protease